MHPLLSSVHTSNFFLFLIVLAVLPEQILTVVNIFFLPPGFDRKAAGISLLTMTLLLLLRENYFFRLKTYQYITYFCFIQSLRLDVNVIQIPLEIYQRKLSKIFFSLGLLIW